MKDNTYRWYSYADADVTVHQKPCKKINSVNTKCCTIHLYEGGGKDTDPLSATLIILFIFVENVMCYLKQQSSCSFCRKFVSFEMS